MKGDLKEEIRVRLNDLSDFFWKIRLINLSKSTKKLRLYWYIWIETWIEKFYSKNVFMVKITDFFNLKKKLRKVE